MEMIEFYGRYGNPIIVGEMEESDEELLQDNESEDESIPTHQVSSDDANEDDDGNSDDLVTEASTSKSKPNLRRHIWKSIGSDSSPLASPEWLDDLPASEAISSPCEYFRRFFDSTLMQYIVEQSNLYSIQKDPSKPLDLTTEELELFFSAALNMSIVTLPRTRLYWSQSLGIGRICEIISRVRFEQIKSSVHFNDNSKIGKPGDNNYDRLFKVRPLLTHLRQKYNAIPMSQMMCIDEQMIPFKGASSMKQYMPNKPHKYGYKVFLLCDSNGIVYDFEIYSGKVDPPENGTDLGTSSNLILRLAKSIPSNKNYLLYFDNWFTSIPVICELAKRKIYSLGTVRANRLQGCPIISNKDIKGKGRGTCDEKEANIDSINVRVIKWLDTKSVLLLTTFESASPMQTVERWDKKNKSKINVPCPQAVKTYNKFMGGVDLLDSLIGLYRTKIRSKKYYHRIYFHFLDITVVNCWLLYKRDCKNIGLLKSKHLTLLEFKHSIANSLSREGKTLKQKKRGRSSSSVDTDHKNKRRLSNATKPIPEKQIRGDMIDHFPIYKETRGRCKLPGCKSSPYLYCQKCETYLCIDRKKNCFLKFHKD